MPAWRMAPPRRCFQRQAWPMKSREPHSTAPSGAPRPLVKSSQTESKPATISAGGMAAATQAFISRAPSMCVLQPCSRATATTALSCSSGQTAPPPILAVCSTSRRRCGGAWRVRGRIAARTSSAVNMPRGPRSGRICTPVKAACAPPSEWRMWLVSCASTSSPLRQWVRIATTLHMVPEGRNTAASLPISAAMRSQRAWTVGSSPCCSSPTSARIMASFIAAVGRVWVSE